MIRIGTSGYSYEDWLGPVYPEGTKSRDYLRHYIRLFDTVELNYTYYRPPSEQTLETMAAIAPEGFLFTLKATRQMTLEACQDPGIYSQYANALAPLIDSGKFGAVLLQFPNAFKLSRAAVQHLEFIRNQWTDMPLVVEFRDRSWVDDTRTFDFLRDHNLAFCCVDQPQFKSLLPPMAAFTAEPAYVRLHGRNHQKWWHHDHAWERYDYLYDEEELRQWLPKVRQLDDAAETTYVMFNNHHAGQAVQNAQQLTELLHEST
jgi:uncharacterized protein YecE (DUF72 family)